MDPEVAELWDALSERVPGEWSVWRNAGRLHAWRKKTSPPVVFQAATHDEVMEAVEKWIATGRHPGLPETQEEP